MTATAAIPIITSMGKEKDPSGESCGVGFREVGNWRGEIWVTVNSPLSKTLVV